MMSGVDKLHKIFSTEVEPLVWARSVGFEVVNELDALKDGIMMAAGANPASNRPVESLGWDFAAGAVKTLSSASRAIRAVKSGVDGAVSSALKSLTVKT